MRVPVKGDAAFMAFEKLCNAWIDYEKTVQCEQTKRAEIQAWRDVRLAELQNQRDLLENYLADMFKERALIIREMFARLDAGIERDNSVLISESIKGIIAVARESPLKEVRRIMNDMSDPSVKMIEI